VVNPGKRLGRGLDALLSSDLDEKKIEILSVDKVIPKKASPHADKKRGIARAQVRQGLPQPRGVNLLLEQAAHAAGFVPAARTRYGEDISRHVEGKPPGRPEFVCHTASCKILEPSVFCPFAQQMRRPPQDFFPAAVFQAAGLVICAMRLMGYFD